MDLFIKILCVLGFTATGAICDWRTRRLPNALTVSAFFTGLLFHAFLGDGLPFAMTGFVAGFSILFLVWILGGGGAGDFKFMGALGIWMGWRATLFILCISCVMSVFAVGCFTVFETVRRLVSRDTRKTDESTPDDNGDESNQKQRPSPGIRLPFGIPIAVATWLYVIYVELVRPALLE